MLSYALFSEGIGNRKNNMLCRLFSGKGQFEDGNPGSPLIALQIRDKCSDKRKCGLIKCAIETTFIDLNYLADLQINLAPYNNAYGSPNIVSGKYEENS